MTRSDTLADTGFRDQLLAEVERQVDVRLRQLAERGGSADELGDPDELAGRMVEALPLAGHPLDVDLGPFYDTGGLAGWWRVSRQAISDRVRRGTLLACRTEDAHLLYPSFQFARDGSVRPGVLEAVGVFARAGVDGWTAAVWFTSASPVFEGASAVDHLVLHRASSAAIARVVTQARTDSAAWAA